MTNPFRPLPQLFAAPYSEDTVAMAKQYIIDNGHTQETVRIIKKDGLVIVESLK